MWGMVKTSPLKPSPQGIYNPVVMQGNEAGGAIVENEGFQDPDPLVPVQPSITSKLVVWPFQVTGSVIALSETDKVAFARGLDATQEDNSGRMYSDVNRQWMGTGTGQITLANGAGAATTALIVDDPLPFRIGMRIDLWTAIAGTKQVLGVVVNSINIATSTLTLASAQTWSDDAIICKKGVLDGVVSGGPYKEIMGWRGFCDTTTFSTTFQGVSASTYPQWRGNVVSAASGPVSQDLLQRTYNRGPIVGGETADTLFSNYGQARTYLNTQLSQTRYEPGEIKGGNLVLEWGALKWVVDHTAPIAEVGFMVKSGVEKFQVRDIHLSNLPGQTLYQIVGRDAVGGYYRYQGNIGGWKRNNQSRLIDLTEAAF